MEHFDEGYHQNQFPQFQFGFILESDVLVKYYYREHLILYALIKLEEFHLFAIKRDVSVIHILSEKAKSNPKNAIWYQQWLIVNFNFDCQMRFSVIVWSKTKFQILVLQSLNRSSYAFVVLTQHQWYWLVWKDSTDLLEV